MKMKKRKTIRKRDFTYRKEKGLSKRKKELLYKLTVILMVLAILGLGIVLYGFWYSIKPVPFCREGFMCLECKDCTFDNFCEKINQYYCKGYECDWCKDIHDKCYDEIKMECETGDYTTTTTCPECEECNLWEINWEIKNLTNKNCWYEDCNECCEIDGAVFCTLVYCEYHGALDNFTRRC